MGNKSVIFDFNGTLIWDTKLHNKAWDIFLEQYQIILTDEVKHNKVHGRLNCEILTDIFDDELTNQQIQEYIIEKEHIYQDLFTKSNITFAPGVVDLFERLIERDVRFTIATASGIENLEYYIKKLNLSQWFDTDKIVYNDGTMRGKPYPDLFLKAIEKIDAKPSQCIIFEDSVSGIKAAEAAGVGEIVIVNSNNEAYPSTTNKYQIITAYSELDIDSLLNKV